jgi:hypothetical protein
MTDPDDRSGMATRLRQRAPNTNFSLATLLNEAAATIDSLIRERDGERIVCAAIKRGNFIHAVLAPARHGDIFRSIGVCDVKEVETQGFLTSAGRFVDRVEGAKIADAAGQRKPTHVGRDELYTEDMW